jgi:hypothetical protein
MAANVPLTIQTLISSPSGGYTDRVVIGTQQLMLDPKLNNCYWALVIDRTNLNVAENFSFKDNQTIPALLLKYNNNPQYLLVLTTQMLRTAFIPAGQFYAFLQQLGSGNALQRIEQIYQTLGCGNWSGLSYTMVAAFDGSIGFDFSAYHGDQIYTVQLVPASNPSGGVLYTPVKME